MIATVLAVLAAAPPARAQPAEAEALFREGKRLMADGEVARACRKFDASERLDPAIGTELNLGDCLERNGQLASAWAMFVKAAESAERIHDHRRGAEARRRAARLKPRLVYLTVTVPDDRVVDGLELERNGTAFDRALWNQRLPVDPDDYEIAASAPGYVSWHRTVTVHDDDVSVEVPRLEHKPADVAPANDDRSDHEVERDERDERTERAIEAPRVSRRVVRPRRYIAATVTLAVIGAGALATGATFGYLSQQAETSSDAVCPGLRCADPNGIDENHRARQEAMIADGAFVGGGVLLATAGILWLVGRPVAHDERVSLAPVPHGAGVAIGGRF